MQEGRKAPHSRSATVAEAMRINGSLIIRNRKKVIFSAFLIAATVSCLLAITPPASDAATGMATIDISTLDGVDKNNAAAAATESQWQYVDIDRTLYLYTASGNYTLQGTNGNLRVFSSVPGVNLTLNGANITSIDVGLEIFDNMTITLKGNSVITSYHYKFAAILLRPDTSVTINGTGTLNAGASVNIGGLWGAYNNTLTIGGTATVNLNATGNGITMEGGGVINIAAGAKLNSTGMMGLAVGLGSMKIKCDGTATFTGGLWGVLLDGASTFEGTGKVTATGGSIDSAIGTSDDIGVGDQVTLVMKNNSGVDETHTFIKASSANTHQWKLTNATLTSGNLTGATIGVKVAAGKTGTVQRIPILSATTDVTFTAEQTGGTIGTASSTGIVLTFSQAVTGLAATNITITNGTGSATKGSLTGSGTTYTIAISSVTQGNVTVAISNFGSFNVTGGAKTVAVYSASTVYDVKNGADGTWTKGTDNGHAITVGAPSSKVTGVNVDGNPIEEGNYTVANNASGDAVVTLKAAYLETLGLGSHSLKIFMNDGSASTTMTVSAAGDAEGGGGGSNSMLIVAVVIIAILAIAVIAYMFVIKPKMK